MLVSAFPSQCTMEKTETTIWHSFVTNMARIRENFSLQDTLTHGLPTITQTFTVASLDIAELSLSPSSSAGLAQIIPNWLQAWASMGAPVPLCGFGVIIFQTQMSMALR